MRDEGTGRTGGRGRELRRAASHGVLALCLSGAPAALAADGTWTGATNDDFNNPNNWSPAALPGNAAIFGASPRSSVTINAAATLDALRFTSPQAYTITNRSTVMLIGDGISGAGAAPTLINAAGATWRFAVTSSPGGAAIVNNGTMVFEDGSDSRDATITNNGLLTFQNDATVARSTVTTTMGATTVLRDRAGGLQDTRYVVEAGGVLDMSGSTRLDTLAGSIAGAGEIRLATGLELVTGYDNLSTLFSGTITGANAVLTKTGAGTLTLSGHSTFSGGVRIQGGTVVAASDTALGTGRVTVDGTLRLADGVWLPNEIRAGTLDVPTGSGTLLGALVGNAGQSLVKTGAGELVLAGDSPNHLGATIAREGVLVVNGDLSASAGIVQTGATLSGIGRLASLDVQAGGTLAPGNSIGTLAVAGDVAFAAGSVYQVETNDAGQADRIAAGGTATINGGTVQVLAQAGSYRPSTAYTILTAAGGRTGRFDAVTSNFAFLTPSLTYTGTEVRLTLERATADPPPPDHPPPPPVVTFPSVAATPNQRAAAGGAEALGQGHPVFDAVLMLTVPEARAAFDALSGEIHATAQGVAGAGGDLLRHALLSRLRGDGARARAIPTFAALDAVPTRYAADRGPALLPARPAPAPTTALSAWGQALGSVGGSRGDGNAASHDRRSAGFVLGVDATFEERWQAGFAGAFTRSTFDVDGRASSGDVETWHVAAYGGARLGATALRGGLAYGRSDASTRRAAAFRGFGDSLRASTAGDVFQVFGEVGHRVTFGALGLEPFAGLHHLRAASGAIREEGGPAALQGRADHETTASTLGLRLSAALPASAGALQASAMLGWRHAFGDLRPDARLAFRGAPAVFGIQGVPVDRDALVISTGLDWSLAGRATIGLRYDGQVGARGHEHGGRATLDLAF